MIEIAGDESGSDGENIADATHRFFAYGTTCLSANDARDLLREIRAAIGSSTKDIQSARELKSGPLISKHSETVARVLRESPVNSQSSIYVADKWFFLAGKMVSLVIEEQAAEMGIPIASVERQLAVELMDKVAPAIGDQLWADLMTAFNQVVRFYHPASGISSSAMPFLQALNQVRKRWTGQSPVVDMMWKSRFQILQYVDESPPPIVRYLEPMVPTLFAVAGTWSDRFPGVPIGLVADEQSALTADTRALLVAASPVMKSQLASVITRTSHSDPRIQIADLLAGSGRYAAQTLQAGQTDNLTEAVVSLLDRNGMWSDLSPLEAAVSGR